MWDSKRYNALFFGFISILRYCQSRSLEEAHILKHFPVARDVYIHDGNGIHHTPEGLDYIQASTHRFLKKNYTIATEVIKTLNTTTLKKAKTTTTSTASLNLGATAPNRVGTYLEYFCPNGQTLQDTTCVRNTVYQPNPVCPPGTRKHKNQCTSVTPAISQCEAGANLNGRQCTQLLSSTPSYTCEREGEYFDSTTNLCKRDIPSQMRCPTGYTLEPDATCHLAVPPVTQCPDGYTLDATTQTCTQQRTSLGAVQCPENSTYNEDANQCISTTFSPPTCAAGYTHLPEQGRCVALVARVANDCAPGYTLTESGMCQRTLESPSILNCPPGYVLNNNSCRRPLAAAPSCPDGYELTGGTCERIVDDLSCCPDGTTEVTVVTGGITRTQCQTAISANLTQCCGPNFELVNGTCTQERLSTPNWTCEQDCFTVVQNPVSFLCPNGTEFTYLDTDAEQSEPLCIRNTTLSICVSAFDDEDCNNTTQTEGYFLRHLQADNATVCDTTPVCQNVSRIEIFDTQTFCADGGSIVNDTCVTYEPVVPEAICTDGEFDPVLGSCRSFITQAPQSMCPDGTIQSGLSCISYLYNEPYQCCPDGANLNDNGECIMTSEAKLRSGGTHIVTPSASCSDTDVLSGTGDRCLKAIQTSLTYSCPDGSEENADGLCLMSSTLLGSAPTLTAYNPQYVCPDGSNRLAGNMCSTLLAVSAAQVCPDGSVPDDTGTRCLQIQAPVLTPSVTLARRPVSACPKNHKHKDGKCIGNLSSAPLLACEDENARLEGNRCVTVTQPQLVCPKGTVISDEGCVKSATSPARTRVISGCLARSVPGVTNAANQFTVQCFDT